MIINQNLVYITLRMRGGEVAMVVSEDTGGAADVGLKVGDAISGTRAAISTFVVTKSELRPEEFKSWRQKQHLTIDGCAARYGLTVEVVRKYEKR